MPGRRPCSAGRAAARPCSRSDHPGLGHRGAHAGELGIHEVGKLVARHPGGAVAAPFADYITMPGAAEIARPTAAMHHYVDLSRDAYHISAWRAALAAA